MMKLLRALQEAWVSWDYQHFMEQFFVNRFPQYEDYKDEYGNYKLVKGDYPHEKWVQFQGKPLAYICNMDDNTLEEFVKAIEKLINK